MAADEFALTIVFTI